MIDKLIDDTQVRELHQMLRQCKNVVLTCHVRPDGDAIGSSLGTMHLLRSLGINAKVVTPDQPPRALSFLPGLHDVVPYNRYGDYARRLFKEADLLIGCDFNVEKRMSDLAPLFAESTAKKVLIDHHEEPDKFTDLLISYPDMSSTCEVVFRLIAAMGLYEDVDLPCATCLATGIITDTRNLSVNTRHFDLYNILETLLAKGVNKRLILKETMETKSEDALRLSAFAIYERMKVYPKHRAAIVYLTEEDLSRYKYEKGDTEGLVNQALEVRGVIYAVFARQEDSKVRLSMRSIGSFPVSRICSEHFGGGGHLQAAGGDFDGTVQECLALLEKVMPDYDPEVREAAERLKDEGYILK